MIVQGALQTIRLRFLAAVRSWGTRLGLRLSFTDGRQQFLLALRRAGYEIDHEVAADVYMLKVAEGAMQVRISARNALREYARIGDPEVFSRLFDAARKVGLDLPDWNTARDGLLFSLEPNDHDFGTTVRDRVSDEADRVLVLFQGANVAWVREEQLDEWGVSREVAVRLAAHNMERILRDVELELLDCGGWHVGVLGGKGPGSHAFKASMLLAPGFRGLVEGNLGWPVYAVVPCRDFMFVIAKKDADKLGRIGPTVVGQFEQSAYPITTEVLLVTSEGIKAIGIFKPRVREGGG